MPSFGHFLHRLNQPKPNPTHPLVTQLQPPMLPPPPHPKFKFAFSSQMVDTTIQYRQSERSSHLTLRSTLSKFQEEPYDKNSFNQKSHIYSTSPAGEITESLTEMFPSQPESKSPVHRGFAFLKSELFTVGPTQGFKAEIIENKSHSVTTSIQRAERQKTESQQALTIRELYQPLHGPTSTQIYQNLKWGTEWHPLSSLSERSEPQQLFTQSVFPKLNKDPSKLQNYLPYTQLTLVTETPLQSSIHTEQSPRLPEEHLTTSTLPEAKTHPSGARFPQSKEPLTHTETAPLQHGSLEAQSAITPFSSSNWPSRPSTVKFSTGQFNISQQGGSVKLANHTEWHKSSTSQSPMTSNDPRSVKRKLWQCSDALKKGSHFHMFFELQSNTAVSILASGNGEAWRPHCGWSGGLFSLHLHHSFLLFSGPEKPACAAKPSRLDQLHQMLAHILRVILSIPKERTCQIGLFSLWVTTPKNSGLYRFCIQGKLSRFNISKIVALIC